MSTTLQDLVNRAVFFSTEMQTHFGALIADAEWEVDFTSDPHLTFTSAEGTVLNGRPHLLGTESDAQNTWLWAWENINEFPEKVVGLAHDVRKYGAAEDVAELTTNELSLDEELALRLTLAAKVATDRWAHYPAAAGAGTTVWLLVDASELTLPDPQVKTTVRALMQGLTQTTVTDHRAALEAYTDKRGVPTVVLPEGGLRLLFADGCADLSFDEEGRISNCEVGALEGEAAKQYAEATGAAGPASSAGATASEAQLSAPAPPASETPVSKQVGAEAGPDTATSAAANQLQSGSTSAAPAPDSSVPATTSAEAEGADVSTPGSAHPESQMGAEDQPVREQEPAAAAAEEPQGTDSTQDKAEAKPEETKKKKSLFSKLFGR